MNQDLIIQILERLQTIERELEPWICDKICDSLCTDSKLDDAIIASKIKNINGDVWRHNISLQLKLIGFILDKVNIKDFAWISGYIKTHPQEMLPLLSCLTPSSDTEVVFEELKSVKMEEICTLVNKYSMMPMSSIRSTVISFLADYVPKTSECKADGILLEIEDPNLGMDLLAHLCESGDKGSMDLALQLVKQHYSHYINLWDSGSSLRNNVSLNIVRSAMLETHHLESVDDLKSLKIPFNKSDHDIHVLHSTLFNKCVKREDLLNVYLEMLCYSDNIPVLSTVCQLASKQCAIKNVFRKALVKQLGNFPIFQTVLDVVYCELSSANERIRAAAFIESVIDLDFLQEALCISNVCHHHAKCDITDLACFVDSFFTHITESQHFAVNNLHQLFCKIFNLPELIEKCPKIMPKFNDYFRSVILYGESETKQMLLDWMADITCNLLDAESVKVLFWDVYHESDYYIKSSCLIMLSQLREVNLPDDLVSYKNLNTLLRHIQHDDSMVIIAFLNFLRKHFNFIRNLYDDNTNLLFEKQSEKLTLAKIENDSVNESTVKPNLDLDEAINDVCDSKDCEDVGLISAYQDKEMATHGDVTQSLVVNLFSIITQCRCDIEHIQASILLMAIILKQSQGNKKTVLIQLLQSRRFFETIEYYNGPYLKEAIQVLNEELVDGYEIKIKEKDINTDLKTVLNLLEATPDPDIHMDCY